MLAAKLGGVLLLFTFAAGCDAGRLLQPATITHHEKRQEQFGPTCGQYYNTILSTNLVLTCSPGRTCAVATDTGGAHEGIGFCSAPGAVPPTTAYAYGALPTGGSCPNGAICCGADFPSWGIILLNGAKVFALDCQAQPFLFSGTLYAGANVFMPASLTAPPPTQIPTTLPTFASSTMVSTVIDKSVVTNTETFSSSPMTSRPSLTDTFSTTGSPPTSSSTTSTTPTSESQSLPPLSEHSVTLIIVGAVVAFLSIVAAITVCVFARHKRPSSNGQKHGVAGWSTTTMVAGVISALCALAGLAIAIVGIVLKR